MQLSGLGPGDWVTLHARFTPQADFLLAADGRVRTYAEGEARITRLARSLQRIGIGRGDRVALLGVDSPEYCEVLLACMKLGATYVALNFRLSPAEIRTVMAASGAEVIFHSERYREIVESLALRAAVEFESGYEEFLASGPDGGELPSVSHDDDILSISFTSGTTGTPKGVLQSQRMIKAIIQSGVLELGLRPGDLIYAGAPLFHAAGFGHVLYGLARGGASMIMPQWDADLALAWLGSGRVRHTTLVPSMIIQLLEHPKLAEADFSGLRSIMYGGAPMPTSVVRRMVEVFGCDLHNGFGAGTEAGGQLVLRPEDHRRALAGEEWLLGTIGRPAFGCDVRLLDPLGAEVPDGQIGVIASRGDTVMSGYLDRPDLTAAAVRDGWFVAGDLAWKDPEGFLHLAGRADEMIIRGGENVYPVEIEDVVGGHPAVAEIAVVGEPDPLWGQVVTAIVALRDGHAAPSAADVKEHCRGRLASYKVPQRIVVVESFPRNPAGKIDKLRLRELLACDPSAVQEEEPS
ncbi:AMP-binding protein [Dactylosporangium vinaceum]|uniref:Class I adenylate-forming enzyme family protein n=1 Tax=Dactylosporangium vinaceum TaxID=53362 RepID=A0ABV5MFY6_9ACTN|nr:AMP-binding protein [Dactylosporangium vinaceum]UAB98891.1 AMP-binding protein [Dactylosporangium vinaceum]